MNARKVVFRAIFVRIRGRCACSHCLIRRYVTELKQKNFEKNQKMIDRNPVLMQVVQMLRLRDEIVTRQPCECHMESHGGVKRFFEKKTKKVVDSERESG